MKPKEKQNYLKDAKGIALVALVVTIIVMIILAGISISLILGDNRNNNKSNEIERKDGNSKR